MSRQAVIVITKECKGLFGNEHEIPDVYPIFGGDNSNSGYESKEHAAAVLKSLYQNGKREKENDVPISCKYTFCKESEGYAQIVWQNGDIHRYYLIDVQDVGDYLTDVQVVREKENKNADQADSDPWSDPERVLSLSLVHVLPETTEFLAVPRKYDNMFQVFSNDDNDNGGYVIHFTNTDEVFEYDLPQCVQDCIQYAWEKGCSWIYFSMEGNEYPGLPAYRSEWDDVLW